MRISRLATVCVALLATTLVSGAALAKDAKRPAPPKNLRGFLLKPNEPFRQVFPRTPAFAWAPVRGALCYEFELATSRGFAANSLVWSNVQENAGSKACQPVPADPGASTGTASDPATTTTAPATATADGAEPALLQPVRVPAVSVDVVLPWFTGTPYALYARVRAVTSRGPTGWSRPFGFNMRWQSKPAPRASSPGLVRWTPVEGATGYQVWYPQLGKSFSTNTNVADMRDVYTFHRQTVGWWKTVQWRVRAVRRVSGTVVNGLPPVSYGQWSPVFVASNPALTSGPLRLVAATSDRASSRGKSRAHELMPGLAFTGDRALDGRPYELFRAYVATDRDCVNIVFKGSVVGSPAFAPRTSGPLQLPEDEAKIETTRNRPFPQALPDFDNEGDSLTWWSDWRKLVASETIPTAAATAATGTTEEKPVDESATVVQARVDLPDVDFPSTRYYWTVVPVEFKVNPSNDEEAKKPKKGYVDVESPQDACQAGRVLSFGKESDPVETGGTGGAPFVAGLNPGGRFLSSSRARPVVYSTPLVAWIPATGATAYQVQWSKSRYPWRAAGTVKTYATSAVLNLEPGTWYYRVRGLNQTQLRRAEMAWSSPVALRVARPTFSIAR